jgi:hypothetical protein
MGVNRGQMLGEQSILVKLRDTIDKVSYLMNKH